MQVPSLGGEDPLEEDMATHSSVLSWTIPRAEEPGGLQKVAHDWAHYGYGYQTKAKGVNH